MEADRQGGREPALEIVIPARNEARRLPRGLALLCDKLKDHNAAVIVVDNASDDDTARVVLDRPEPIVLLRCDRVGKGAAVRTGLLATTARWVGYCDADMATDLAALDLVLDLLGAGHQVVLGSRRHAGSVVQSRHHPLRKVGALAFSRLSRSLVGGIRDTQCGFKFFDGDLVRSVATGLTTTGFAFDVELLMRCADAGAALTEIPVEWLDVPFSTFSLRRHGFTCVRDLMAIRRMAATRVRPSAGDPLPELQAG